MSALPLTGHSLHKVEMEYHGKFGHTIGRIQNIALMSRIGISYTDGSLAAQNVSPTLLGFQGINSCVEYLTSHPHKPICYPSHSYDGSNVIILTWGGNQVEDHTTQNCLEFHQYADHAIILNIRRPVLGVIHTVLGVAV